MSRPPGAPAGVSTCAGLLCSLESLPDVPHCLTVQGQTHQALLTCPGQSQVEGVVFVEQIPQEKSQG